jgi:general secretion pathway protein D
MHTIPINLSSSRVLYLPILCMLSACAGSPPTLSIPEPAPPAQQEQPALPADAAQKDNAQVPSKRAPVLMSGTGSVIGNPPAPPARKQAPEADDGFQLNFVDMDISTIVASVIGEGFGLPYLVDPQVKGTLSLQSSRALSRAEVLCALEAALRLQGAALVAANGGYNVVPLKDAARQVTGLRTASGNRPGFGIQVVPLKYISVADMEKVLRPLAPEGSILRVDESRNLLLLAGTSQELATLMDAVQTFDVDWLAGMSFALYPLEYADAASIATDLGQLFADPKSPIAGLVKLVPLARLNSLLVVTQQAEYLKKVEAMIKQLDVGLSSRDRRVYVYDVQNGKASDLADSLSRIFFLSSGVSDKASQSKGAERSRSAYGVGDSLQPGAREGFGAGGAGISPNGHSSLNNGLNIVPNEESNSLLIFALPEEFAVIEAALKRLDVEPIQVLIEASLAEVTLTDKLRFGLQWAYQTNQGPVVLSEAGNGGIQQQFPGLSFLFTGRQDIQSVLNTLESLTNVNVISSPKLLVLNNHEAQLQVGDQVPIATQTAVSTIGDNSPIVNTVELRDTGVILRITPRVNKNGLLLLDISQEISDVVATTTSSINSPTIQQRKVSSSVAVHDNETIALGGLIRDSRSKSRGGVPLLRRIPVLGTLFGSVDNSRTRTELIVLLTPHVIRSKEEAAQMMDELREKFRSLRKTMPPPKTAAP